MISARAALTAAARECLAFESIGDFTPEAARSATREMLHGVAQEHGLPSDKIDAAIGQALEDAQGGR